MVHQRTEHFLPLLLFLTLDRLGGMIEYLKSLV